MSAGDSKYFSTAKKIDRALLELLEKKEFEYISVTEICRKAGVHRSTFYLHYSTVADLVNECTRYIMDDFFESMPDYMNNFPDKIKNCTLKELFLVTPEYLTPYLTYIKEHKKLFRLSMEQASTLQMENVFHYFCDKILVPVLERFKVPRENMNYMIAYYVNGLTAIIMTWIKNDCKDSYEHIIKIICACVGNHEDKFSRN